jgi:hypothetical protein
MAIREEEREIQKISPSSPYDPYLTICHQNQKSNSMGSYGNDATDHLLIWPNWPSATMRGKFEQQGVLRNRGKRQTSNIHGRPHFDHLPLKINYLWGIAKFL